MATRTDDEELIRAESSCDPTTDLMQAVLDAVSAASGRPVLPDGDATNEPLPPLYGVIDPDALETLFRSARAGTSVTFAYAGCEVTVTASESDDVDVDVSR